MSQENPIRVASMSFEQALAELESISQKMSQGGLPLQESVDLYAKGVELSKHCQKLLNAAQSRISELDEQLNEMTEENSRDRQDEEIPF